MERESQLKSASAEQTVEKGKEVKEASGEKAGGGKVMHLCAAKCKPRGECRQKGVVIAPAGACRNGAKPPLRATALKARLLARRRPRRASAEACVERRGRRRPPCAANGAKGPVRRQLGAKAQLFRQAALHLQKTGHRRIKIKHGSPSEQCSKGLPCFIG